MVNKTSLVSLSFFSSIWWITDEMLGISAVEKYFWLGLKYLISLKKNIMFFINYCTNYNYIHNLFQHLHS